MSKKETIIKNIKEEAQRENQVQLSSDQDLWSYYQSRKTDLFDSFLEKHCQYNVDKDCLELKGYWKISLDSFDPSRVSWWDYLVNKVPSGSFEVRAKIRNDFIAYSKENGVIISGFYYPKHDSF